MKSFLLFLCFAAAEKLDRTYLPPPGAQFSGGAPGDIQAPFEVPKETYATTLRPEIYDNGALSPEDTRIEVGINRGVPRPGAPTDLTSGSQASDYYQTYKVPTTTTSYAFTTTTTHPPGEAYGTTSGPINPVTGLPTTTFDYPTSAPGFLNPELYNPVNQQGTFQQNQVPGRVTPGRPAQYPSSTTIAPGSQFVNQNIPGFIQSSNLDRIQNQSPGYIPGSLQRPIPTLGATQTQYQGNQYQVNVPGVGQQNFVPSTFGPGSVAPTTFSPGTFAPTTFAPGTFAPTTFAPGTTPSSVQYSGDLDQDVSNQKPPFIHASIPAGNSNAQGSYYPGQNQPQYLTPGHRSPQGVSQPLEQVQYETYKGGIPQQYPISQTDEFGRPVAQNNVYPPFSTASSMTPVPNLGQFPSSNPGSLPSATTVYPSGSFSTTPGIVGSQGIQTGLIARPERPQAEADKNAVILNYKNVITPEGFAYSFDTSNGIHADENGTALDGVKASGSYSYIGDDGKLYSIVYTADENGFQPRGDHLPTSPPIPEAILKIIEQAKKDQEAGVSDDGTYDKDKYGHARYEGRRYRPQRPNKINVYDEVSDRHDGQNDQDNRMQHLKPQKGNKRPVSNQDYEDIGEEDKNQIDGDALVNNYRNQPNDQKLFRRPVNRIFEANNEQYNPEIGLGEGSGDELSENKISPQYPIVRPGGNRKQFGGKFSVRRPGQYTESDGDSFRPEEGTSFDTNSPGSLTIQDNYSAGGSRRKPVNNQRNQSPGMISSNDEISNRRSQCNNTGRPSGSVDDYNRPGSKTSIQSPVQYPSEAGASSIPSSPQGQYGNRLRPITSTAQPVDETDVYNYQVSRRPGGLDKYLPNKGYTAQQITSSTTIAPISNRYSESSVDGNKPDIEKVSEQNYRPTSNQLLSRIPESTVFDSTASQVPTTGIPNPDDVTSNRFISTHRRPQSSITSVPQQVNGNYGNRIIEPASNQNGRRPVPVRGPADTTKYTTVVPIKEEGYQYLTPQRKFDQESLRPQGLQMINSNKKSYQDRIYNKEEGVPKSFITPDASRSEDGTEDDYDRNKNVNQNRIPHFSQVQPSQRPVTTQLPNQRYDKESSLNTYEETRPSRPNLEHNGEYENKLDTTRIPDKSAKTTTTDSTRRPPYQQIQTTRPQQQYRPGFIDDTTEGIPSGTVREPQESNSFITSTPVPSQATHYEVTQPSILKPGQQTTDRYIERGQTPSTQGYFTETTKLPAQSNGQFDARLTQNVFEQTSSQSPYQTTNRSMVTYGEGSDEAPNINIRPGRPFGRRGYSQSQVPSTTYRPAYYPGQVTEKQVDTFGRPLPQQPNEGENSQKTSVIPGNVYNPGQVTEKQVTVDNFGRTLPQQPYGGGEYRPESSVTPGNVGPSSQDARRPVQGLRPIDNYGRPTGPAQGNIPSYSGPVESSTTEKIKGEDFSGPKQQLRFDPERGYYY